MDWSQSLSVIDGRLYAGDRWLGSFSSHAAAMSAINAMRNSECFCGDCSPAMTTDDVDLMLAIDADEA